MKGCSTPSIVAMAKQHDDKTLIWHQCLGHISDKRLLMLSKRGLLYGDKVTEVELCEHCIVGKQKIINFSTGKAYNQRYIEYVHSNFWGPSSTPIINVNMYFLTFTNDYS